MFPLFEHVLNDDWLIMTTKQKNNIKAIEPQWTYFKLFTKTHFNILTVSKNKEDNCQIDEFMKCYTKRQVQTYTSKKTN